MWWLSVWNSSVQNFLMSSFDWATQCIMPTGGGGPSFKVYTRVSAPRSMVNKTSTQNSYLFPRTPDCEADEVLEIFLFCSLLCVAVSLKWQFSTQNKAKKHPPVPRWVENQLLREGVFEHCRCRASGILTSAGPCAGLRLATLTLLSSFSRIFWSTNFTVIYRVLQYSTTGCVYIALKSGTSFQYCFFDFYISTSSEGVLAKFNTRYSETLFKDI